MDMVNLNFQIIFLGIFGNNFAGKILDGEFKNGIFIKGKIYY